MASVRAAALSLMTTRVVIASSTTGDGFGGLDSECDVVFDGAKDRTDNDLDSFSYGGVSDKEQNS